MIAEIKIIEWLTLIAVVVGPILAVLVTRYVDDRRERKSRRTNLFKTLMRTRNSRTSPEHVGALNLVEIEYYKETRVLEALEKYFRILNTRYNPDGLMDWAREVDHLFTKLMYEVAKSLGYEIEQLQILSGGYAPKVWNESEQKQNELQDNLASFLKGEVALPIKNFSTILPNSDSSKLPPNFPPAPND